MDWIRSIALLFVMCFSVKSMKAQDKANNIGQFHCFSVADTMPEFPGGNDKLIEYIQAHLSITNCTSNNLKSRIVIRFIVDANGAIKDAKIVEGTGTKADDIALKMVRDMPRWHPAIKNGKPLAAVFSLPIIVEYR